MTSDIDSASSFPLADELARLKDFVVSARGRFALAFVRAGSPRHTRHILAELESLVRRAGGRLTVVDLGDHQVTSLIDELRQFDPLRGEPLVVTGLERSIYGPNPEESPFLRGLNLERDELRRDVVNPLLIWLDPMAEDRLRLGAPDLFDYWSGLYDLSGAGSASARGLSDGHRKQSTRSVDSSLAPKRIQALEAELSHHVALLARMGDIYGLESARDRDRAVDSLHAVGRAWHELGRHGLACDYLRRAAGLARGGAHEAKVLQTLGQALSQGYTNEQANEAYDRARALYRRQGERLGEANCIESLGDVAFQQGRHKEASRQYETALPIYRDIGERRGEANCQKGLGDVARMQGRCGEASQRYETALPIYRDIGARLGEANCIRRLGDLALQLDRYEAASQQYETALPIYRDIGARLGEATCVWGLGEVARVQGRNGAAARQYERALPIYRDIGARLGEATCLRSLGEVALEQGRYGAASQQYETALPIYREIGAQLGEATCLQSLGDAAFQQDRCGEASQRYEMALQIFHDIGARLGEANCIRRLGDVARIRGRYREASQQYKTALSVYRDVGTRLGEANCHKRLGDVARMQGRYGEASQRYETALPIYRDIGARLGEVTCATDLGRCRMARGQPRQGLELLDRGVSLSRDIGSLPAARCLTYRGEARAQVGDADGALSDLRRALALFEDAGLEQPAGEVRNIAGRFDLDLDAGVSG